MALAGLEPRPFRSVRSQSYLAARPLSATSSLSAVSSSSSITGERRRRSTALLEEQLGTNPLDDTPERRSIRNSITRAEEVLRASERQREIERRKERAGWRARQVGRSTRLLDHLEDDTTEELDSRGCDSLSCRQTRKEAQQASRILRKAKSIPTELLFSPAVVDSVGSDVARDGGSRTLSRPASSAAILTKQTLSPSQPLHDGERSGSPYLPVPDVEPTSKFSASSGDSLVHVFVGKRPVRLQDRARSINQASTNGIRSFGMRLKSKTPSKTNLRKKPSLAGIFRDLVVGEEDPDNRKDHVNELAQRRSSSRLRTLSHRPTTSVSSSAPSTDRESDRRESSRLTFLRSALRDSTKTSSSETRPRSSGTISPSIISNPLSTSSGAQSSDQRNSEATESSANSNDKGDRKIGWVTKLGRTIKRKNAATKRTIFEDEKENEGRQELTVHVAEKVKVGSPSPRMRPPSHIPVKSLFRVKTGTASAPPRPRRPSSDLVSSDDSTFYGHRVPLTQQVSVPASKVVDVISSDAPRVRAKSAVARNRPSRPTDSARPILGFHQPQVGPRSETPLPFSNLVLLPAADIVPSHALPARKFTLDSFERELACQQTPSSPPPLLLASPSSSHGDARSSSSAARSFRSPSPARFRDLLPSSSASSPEKNDKGLPMPLKADPTSANSRASPIRRRVALGPEQIICMTDARERTGPISEVRGATTDLAELLSGLEETQDYDRSRNYTTASSTRSQSHPTVPPLPSEYRQEIPRFESVESLRSTVSDVPNDLRDLIDAVDNHISEVDVPSLVIDGSGMRDRGFADEGFDSSEFGSGSESESASNDEDRFGSAISLDGSAHSAVRYRSWDDGFTTDEGATSTSGFDHTASTFEGHVSTAAHVLRDMLSGDRPRTSLYQDLHKAWDLPHDETSSESGEEEDEEGDLASLRDSVREALEVGRPSAGERMFDRVDSDVSLSALVTASLSASPVCAPSRPSMIAASFSLGHFRHESVISSSEGSTESTGLSLVPSSPTPNLDSGRSLRSSLARYSQDAHYGRHRPTHSAAPTSHGSSSISSQPSDPTTSSNAPSSRSTNLSISSIASSPCPLPRGRPIPMLTRVRPPPLQPSFRFPTNPVAIATSQVSEGATLTNAARQSDSESKTDEIPSREARGLPIKRPVSGPETIPAFDTSFNLQPLGSQLFAPETILEEDESLEISPFRSMGLDMRLRPLSSIVGPQSPSQRSSSGTTQNDQGFRDEHDYYDDVLDSEDDYDYTARDPGSTRKFVHLDYEAETEIRRSQAIWPDTDRSREAVALFDAPKTYRAILDFLFSSQDRFPSPALARLGSFVPLAFADPPTPPSPISPISPVPIPSPLRDQSASYLARTTTTTTTVLTHEIPHVEAQHLPPSLRPCVVEQAVPSVSKATRQPLRKVLGTKSVNNIATTLSGFPSSVVETKGGTGGEDVLSPFTALPPRLGSKFRASAVLGGGGGGGGGLRSRSVPSEAKENENEHDERERGNYLQHAAAKLVDTSFLGDVGASRRRQAQFNAAARRLEGTGFPSEQRSDDDDTTTDDLTGIAGAGGRHALTRGGGGGGGAALLLEGDGEASNDLMFTKTPPTVSKRARGPRRHFVSALR